MHSAYFIHWKMGPYLLKLKSQLCLYNGLLLLYKAGNFQVLWCVMELVNSTVISLVEMSIPWFDIMLCGIHVRNIKHFLVHFLMAPRKLCGQERQIHSLVYEQF